MAQTELTLDDARAERVPPDPHEISVDIKVDLMIKVDVAKLAFLYSEEIESDATTEILRSDGYGEEDRFEVWLHYHLLDRTGLDVCAPRAEGVREIWGNDPEISFRLNDKDRAAIDAGFNPRWAIPAE